MLQQSVLLSLYHDDPPSAPCAEIFERESTLDRLKVLDSRVRRKGLGSLDPSRNELIRIGMEIDARGGVVRSGYGVLNLSWQALQHPEWAEMIGREAEEIRDRLHDVHRQPLRFLIWTSPGGPAEDKALYNAAGLLRDRPRCYILDSTDPAKLKCILEDIAARSKDSLAAGLKSTLVVAMSAAITSSGTLINAEKLSSLYGRLGVDSRPNFLFMTPNGSLLDRFARDHEYPNVELQPDGADTVAGWHSAPLTRGALYPLALARQDLRRWIEGASLTEDHIHTAWRLAAFLHAQGCAGRDKVTLMLPREWAGAALWTKQNFEESLGKCEQHGIRIVTGERIRLANYRPPKDAAQDRVFLTVQIKGGATREAEKVALLRRAGYPVAVLTARRCPPLSTYMQFIHYAVFGLARLRHVNFVTQSGAELYSPVAGRIYAEAQKAGGVERSRAWQSLRSSPRQARWRGGITLNYDKLPVEPPAGTCNPAAIYAHSLQVLASSRQAESAELVFYGDTRYSAAGRALRRVLDRAAEHVFRSRLKMPADVSEGPAANRGMSLACGRCFSTVLLSEQAECIPELRYNADHHRAQFLSAIAALADRKRPVVAILLKDLEETTLTGLDQFFRQVASDVPAGITEHGVPARRPNVSALTLCSEHVDSGRPIRTPYRRA